MRDWQARQVMPRLSLGTGFGVRSVPRFQASAGSVRLGPIKQRKRPLSRIRNTAFALVLAISTLATPALAQDSNKEFVVTAVTELFINRDLTAIDRYWAEDYRQRNPMFPSGSAVIKEAFANLPENFRYEIGMVIAEGDLVAIHGRYSGWSPTPLIVVDIFRVENGKIAEHWDVGQEEVLETASGLPMFEPMK